MNLSSLGVANKLIHFKAEPLNCQTTSAAEGKATVCALTVIYNHIKRTKSPRVQYKNMTWTQITLQTIWQKQQTLRPPPPPTFCII